MLSRRRTGETPRTDVQERLVPDLLSLALTGAFFALAALVLAGLERL